MTKSEKSHVRPEISATSTASPPSPSRSSLSSTVASCLGISPWNAVEAEDYGLYESGGFHPVHIGEFYDRNRYEIVHKLGYGGYSTVWLARDTNENGLVALKIVAAEFSQDYKGLRRVNELALDASEQAEYEYFTTVLRTFEFDGPNGHHICLVLPLLGPNMAQSCNRWGSMLKSSWSRQFALQGTRAIAYLHAKGVCHGDLTSGNVLFRLSDSIHSLTNEELYLQLGEPERDIIDLSCEMECPGLALPRYLVPPTRYSHIKAGTLQKRLGIVDFDQAFLAESPPATLLQTPSAYLSPEAIFELEAGYASDIWALGCLIFRMRAGFDIFEEFGSDAPYGALLRIVNALGELPPCWRAIRFGDDGYPIRNNVEGSNENGNILYCDPLSTPLKDIILSIPSKSNNHQANQPLNHDSDGDVGDRPPFKQQCTGHERLHDADPISPTQSDIFWKPPLPPSPAPGLIETEAMHSEGKTGPQEDFCTISPKEAELLHDLLSKVFVYDAKKRISAAEMLMHPWFCYND